MSSAPENTDPSGRQAQPTGGTTEELRRSNLSRALGFIHREGPLSRADLTRLTGLNRSTIGVLVAELRELALVYETMPGSGAAGNRAGRPSPIIHASERVVAIVVNPEVDALHIGIVTLGGVVAKRIRLDVAEAPAARDVVEMTRAAIAGLLAGSSNDLLVAGIGVAVPGLVRAADGQVRSADHLGWFDEPLTEMIAAATGYRTWAANAAQLGMRAESVFGAGRGVDDLVYLIGGSSGIGGGVVSGGHPLAGAEGYAAEFGHTFVQSAGAPCPCGSNGCFEAEVTQSALLDVVGLTPSGVDLLAERLAASTDPDVHALVARDRQLVQVAMKNAVNLFNPSVVIVGGFLAALYADGTPTVADVAAQSIEASRESLTITTALLGGDQLLIGAGELVFAELLADPAAASFGPVGDDVLDEKPSVRLFL